MIMLEVLKIIFWLLAGANFQSGTLQTSWNTRTTTNDAVGQVNLADDTANEWYITGVQLEAGTTASDFEFLPVDVNLQRCYRYCYRVNGNSTDDQMFGAIGFFGTTSRADVMMSFNPPMRTVPTVTEGIINVIPPGSNASLSAVFDDNEPNDCVALGVNFTADSGTPFTANQTAIPRISANASGFIQFDAEL
jgi:hypothetical protein